MSRYIDAERIDFRLIRPTYITTGEECMFLNIRNLIDRQPTADVQETVHGKWVEEVDTMGGYEDYYPINYYCSKCEYLSKDGKTNYCPNCGADMRGERRENECY